MAKKLNRLLFTYILNFSISGYISIMFLGTFLIIINPQTTETYNNSIILLIKHHSLLLIGFLLVSLICVSVLNFLNKKLNNSINKQDLLGLKTVNSLILFSGATIGFFAGLFQLLEELERIFS
jgi:hypothetical protein